MRVGMVLLSAGLIAAAGCGDECTEGATRCANNATQRCSAGYSEEHGVDPTIRWRQEYRCESPSTCIMPEGKPAMCVMSTDPDPLCAGALRYCTGDTIISCEQGYRTAVERCGGDPFDPASTRCIAIYTTSATCVPPEAMPNDACPSDPPTAGAPRTICAGDVSIVCQVGLAIATTACGACYQDQLGLRCNGFLGATCNVDGECAAGMSCRPDSSGTSRCTAPCDPSDPNAAKGCEDLFVAGGPPPSAFNPLTPGRRMTCTAGFCEWAN